MLNQDTRHAAGSKRTRFARCNRWQAAAIVLAVLAAMGGCIVVALTHDIRPKPSKTARQTANGQTADADFYRAVIGHVHAGDGYYDAVALELRARGYKPHSVFNWRPPLYAWIFGVPPSPFVARILLTLLAIAVWVTTFQVLRAQAGPGQAVLAALLLLGPLAWFAFADVALFSELWSGLLIALSLMALARDRQRLGWAAALVAVGFRELALPYYCLATLLAYRQRRCFWLWAAGLMICAVYFALHIQAAGRHLDAADVIHARGWFQGGGMVFVLLTAQMNVFLIVAPSVVTALYLPLALLGLTGWRGPSSGLAAVTVFAFVSAFTLIGLWPHNAYWGLMYAPLLSTGLALAPAAVADLSRALLHQSLPSVFHQDDHPRASSASQTHVVA